jgi:hypothetical protein
MGAADSFWRLPGVTRSDNVFAFAAKGPLARAITAPQPFSPPHGIDSPVGRIAALGGFVLLLGTGHSSNTTVHLAESLAGVPYHVRKSFTAIRDGAPVRVEYDETDHCCENFDRLDAWLRERKLQTEGPVGHGAARLARGADVARVAVEHLVRDPFAFLHPRGSGCVECEQAWKSVGQRPLLTKSLRHANRASAPPARCLRSAPWLPLVGAGGAIRPTTSATAAPTAMSRSSCHRRPTSWAPIGNPPDVQATGTTSEGIPV